MSIAPWHEEPVAKRHNRQGFDCGEPELNDYLRLYARQNHESGAAKTFVAVPNEDGHTILGYFSLAPASVEYARAPGILKRGLARHNIPAFRLGRLAVDRSKRGQRLGGHLLLSAGRRCILAAAEVGGLALLIDAKNERVAAWYASYGALPLLDAPLSLLLPLATLEAALREPGKL